MKKAQEALAKNLAEMKGFEERLKNEVLADYKAQIRALEAEKAELERLFDKTQAECNFMKTSCAKLRDELYDVKIKKEELEQRGGTVVSKINAELDKALAEIQNLKKELEEAVSEANALRKQLLEARNNAGAGGGTNARNNGKRTKNYDDEDGDAKVRSNKYGGGTSGKNYGKYNEDDDEGQETNHQKHRSKYAVDDVD